MKVVSDVKTKQELDEIKTVMEIFIINNRLKELARLA